MKHALTMTAALLIAAPIPVLADHPELTTEVKDRLWFVGMIAALRCKANQGKIETFEGFNRLAYWHMKRRNKLHMQEWSLTEPSLQATKLVETTLDPKTCLQKEGDHSRVMEEVVRIVQ